MIDPIPEYFNDNISLYDSNACLTCNVFISDQSFESNLTGRMYKTQTYMSNLPVDRRMLSLLYTAFDVV